MLLDPLFFQQCLHIDIQNTGKRLQFKIGNDAFPGLDSADRILVNAKTLCLQFGSQLVLAHFFLFSEFPDVDAADVAFIVHLPDNHCDHSLSRIFILTLPLHFLNIMLKMIICMVILATKGVVNVVMRR